LVSDSPTILNGFTSRFSVFSVCNCPSKSMKSKRVRQVI
jgi:hypothetical protein